ncbi:unnamed protein product [Bursaphelenchus xylophilus]|uniref:(pine wood nematode) hypothetical protein n=1 Tax=Bursaphelenchus xylophilus TaxID=6326 RepID=A0A1I7RL11_BURXY|nr:unnamed protein product [Bursaphelenchus xylophilus]CAG9083608.1 unnamed protein product [Bursaphelenchus xylophilus]
MSAKIPTSSLCGEDCQGSLDGDIFRRLYMKEELDSLHLSKMDSEMIRKCCADLVGAAEYFYGHQDVKISQAFVRSDFELIFKSGMINCYLEMLGVLIQKIALSQLHEVIAVTTSPPLFLIPDLWNKLLEAVSFLFKNFCVQVIPNMDLKEKLIDMSKKIFLENVLSSPHFSRLDYEDFDDKINVEKSSLILNNISPTFFTSYIRMITSDYCFVVNEIQDSFHPRQFTRLIVQWLEDELRAAKGLGFTQDQMKTFNEVLYKTFVMDYLTRLLRNENIDVILENLDCAVFHIWFMLYSKVEGGLDVLMEMVAGYMTRKCGYFAMKRNTVEKSALPTVIIKDLISFKKVIDLLQSECCNGDSMFKSRIQSQLHRVFNSVDKFAEFLAIYFDVELRQNKVDQMDNVLGLVHYVSSKEDFERLYKIYLARRLVGANVLNLELERTIIESLKVEFGNVYTRRMEKMFKDMEMSFELLREFAASQNLPLPADGVPRNDGLKFSITVITPGFWPQMNSLAPCSLPSQLSSAFHDFEHFYTKKYPTRRLGLNVYNGFTVVEARFFGQAVIDEVKDKIERGDDSLVAVPSDSLTTKSLVCTPVQTAVLDLFNSCCYVNSNKLKSMGDSELKKGIPSLIRGKILIKEFMVDMEGNEQEVYYINDVYSHKKTTINLTKEAKNDEGKGKKADGLAKNIYACRYLIDAAIVRIMKAHKTLPHDQLRTSVMTKLERPVDENLLKKCIENLIDHHYLKREEDNPRVYHYAE